MSLVPHTGVQSVSTCFYKSRRVGAFTTPPERVLTSFGGGGLRSASLLIDLSIFVVADWACTVVILYFGAGLVAGLVDLWVLDFGSLVLNFGFLGQGSPFVMIVAPSFGEEALVHL